MFENPYLPLSGTNAVCAPDDYNEVWDGTDRIMKYYFISCYVTFVSSSVPYKRSWEVDEVKLPDNWREDIKGVAADELEDFLTYGIAEMLGVTE